MQVGAQSTEANEADPYLTIELMGYPTIFQDVRDHIRNKNYDEAAKIVSKIREIWDGQKIWSETYNELIEIASHRIVQETDQIDFLRCFAAHQICFNDMSNQRNGNPNQLYVRRLAIKGQLEALKVLFQSPSPSKCSTDCGFSLQDAVYSGNIQVISFILDLVDDHFSILGIINALSDLSENHFKEILSLLLGHPKLQMSEKEKSQFFTRMMNECLRRKKLPAIELLHHQYQVEIEEGEMVKAVKELLKLGQAGVEACNQLVKTGKNETWGHPDLFAAAILGGRDDWIERLLACLNPNDFSLEQKGLIWEAVLCIGDYALLERLLTWGLDVVVQEEKTLLELIADNQEVSFRDRAFKLLLKHQPNAEKVAKLLYEKALLRGDAGLCYLIWDQFHFGKPPATALLGEIDPEKEPERFSLRIQEIAHRSSWSSFERWTSSLSSLLEPEIAAKVEEGKNAYLRWAPYVAQYAGKWKPSIDSNSKEDDQGHLVQQITLGNGMAESVAKQLENWEGKSFQQILEGFQSDRLNLFSAEQARLKQLYKGFRSQMVMFMPIETRLYNHGAQNLAEKLVLNHRYSFAHKICFATWSRTFERQGVKSSKELQNIIPTLLEKEVEIIAEPEIQAFQILHKSTLENRYVPLTNVSQGTIGWGWTHTQGNLVPMMMVELEAGHGALLQMDVKTEEEKKTFVNALAGQFWLMCHVMPAHRGTSQYSLNYLGAWCLRNGLQAPIASKDYPELNVVALSMEKSAFVEHFSEMLDVNIF